VYLCLRRIVSAFGPENSRLPPEYYTRIVSQLLFGTDDISPGSGLICLSLVHPLRCHISRPSSPRGCYGFNCFSPAQKS
jgi:hypothetical protein